MYMPKTLHEGNVHNNCLMILNKLEGCTQEKKIPYGDLDFWNFVPKSIGSSVSENFANFWCFQKIRLKGFLLEN